MRSDPPLYILEAASYTSSQVSETPPFNSQMDESARLSPWKHPQDRGPTGAVETSSTLYPPYSNTRHEHDEHGTDRDSILTVVESSQDFGGKYSGFDPRPDDPASEVNAGPPPRIDPKDLESRTPSPTPSELRELKSGVIDWQGMKSRSFWFRREWICEWGSRFLA